MREGREWKAGRKSGIEKWYLLEDRLNEEWAKVTHSRLQIIISVLIKSYMGWHFHTKDGTKQQTLFNGYSESSKNSFGQPFKQMRYLQITTF